MDIYKKSTISYICLPKAQETIANCGTNLSINPSINYDAIIGSEYNDGV